jgi:thioesterase domain-containing protein
MRRIQPKGPYYLLGYCYGGLVAYEIAQQLHACGERVAFLGLLDAAERKSVVEIRRNDSWLMRFQQRLLRILGNVEGLPLRRKLAYLPERTLSRILRLIYWVAPSLGVRSIPSFLKSVEDILWVAGKTYAPQPWPGRLTIFRASKQSEIRLSPDLGWARLAKEGVAIVEVPGGHFDVFSKENVNVLADRLRESLGLSENAA